MKPASADTLGLVLAAVDLKFRRACRATSCEPADWPKNKSELGESGRALGDLLDDLATGRVVLYRLDEELNIGGSITPSPSMEG